MSSVTPAELVVGVARGQRLVGRVCLFTTGQTLKGQQFSAFHLVVKEGLSGVLFIEAWRDHARRVATLVTANCILEVCNITAKALGDKAQWQCSDLDVYGQVLGPTTLNLLDDDGTYPKTMPLVELRQLPNYRRIPHLISIAAMLVPAAPSSSSKATAPATNLVLGAETQSVRVAVWKDMQKK